MSNQNRSTRDNPVRLAVFCVALLLLATAAMAQFVMGGVPADTPAKDKSGDSKPMPLVNADPDILPTLSRIESLIRDKAYADAIRLLQQIIDTSDTFIDESSDGRSFRTARIVALRMIGQMPEEGLALYRAMYDAQAQKQYKDSLEIGDISSLQQVADRYLFATVGPTALEAVASIHFDSGRFYQAAYAWRQLLQMKPDAPEAALWKAKAAVALHLAGEKDVPGQMLAELKKEFPQATAIFGGTQQNLVDFVTRALSMQVSWVAGTKQAGKMYPGIGGTGNGIWRMDDVDVVLDPRWCSNPRKVEDASADVVDRLIISPDSVPRGLNPQTGQPMKSTAQLVDGQIKVRGVWQNGYNYGQPQRTTEYVMPAIVQPVVVGDKVIYRTGTTIEARDMIDGEIQWQSQQLLVRKLKDKVQANYGYQTRPPGDLGRYSLTVGQGLVFGLSNFRPPVTNQNMGPFVNPGNANKDPDSSKLLALSVETGKLVWEVGSNDSAADSFYSTGKFICAPTYSNGRLYIVAMNMENGFYLVCLNAATGEQIYRQFVAQSPTLGNANMGWQVQPDQYHIGSPPAVSDGRVYVLTNLGVLTACDAQTGQPIWAYQYASQLENRTDMRMWQPQMQQAAKRPFPANPVIVAHGRIICLPADSNQVVAFSCDDGTPVWKMDRTDRADLSGIDDSRVCVSGEGLLILSTVDGKELFDAHDAVKNINGRPAVTQNSILASGLGMMYRLNLNDYRVSTIELTHPDGLLGNLVSVDGKLIAANAAGVCAYLPYDLAREKMLEKIAKAPDAEKPDLVLSMGQLAFNGRKYNQAISDFIDCQKLAKEQGDNKVLEGVRSPLRRAYIAQANVSEKPEQMVELFKKAYVEATTDQEKCKMQVRLAKAYTLAGQYALAAACLQEMAEQFPKEEIADVNIGPTADPLVRETGQELTKSVSELAPLLLNKLIEEHGREGYAQFDQKADAAFKDAQAKADSAAMEQVAVRWPNAACATEALFQAAQIHYRASLAAKGEEKENLLNKAEDLLYKIRNKPKSPQYASAVFALAWMDPSPDGTYGANAAVLIEPLRELPPMTPIAFHDVRGNLGDLIKKLESGGMPNVAGAVRVDASIEVPLRQRFTVGDADTYILRDQDYNPVRVGPAVAVLQGRRAMLLNSLADTAADAIGTWSGLTKADATQFRQRFAVPAMGLLAGMSKDGKILAVADRNSVTGLDAVTSKIKWSIDRVNDIGIIDLQSMAIGEGKLVMVDRTGKVSCVDLADGKNLWQGTIARNKTAMANMVGGIGTPQIGGGLVAIMSGGMRSIMCFNLANGKAVEKWDATRWAEASFSPSGLMVTMIDGELAIREVSRLSKPVWSKKYDNPDVHQPYVLAINRDHVAVLTSRSNGTIEILSLVGGGKVSYKFKAGDTNAGPAQPVQGFFDDKSFYTINMPVTPGAPGFVQFTSRFDTSRQQVISGLNVQRFALSDRSEPMWNRNLETPPGGVMPMPLTIGKGHVGVMAKAGHNNAAAVTFILDIENGQVVQKIDVGGKDTTAGFAVQPSSHMALVGPPVMTKGHLVVETTEGVSVYGK